MDWILIVGYRQDPFKAIYPSTHIPRLYPPLGLYPPLIGVGSGFQPAAGEKFGGFLGFLDYQCNSTSLSPPIEFVPPLLSEIQNLRIWGVT